MIECKNVHKKYGKEYVLKAIDLKVPEGSIYGLIGTNGAGKSTLIKSIMGIVNHDRGHIKLMGKETEFHKISKKKIGTLFEIPAFYPNLTGLQNLEYYRRLFGCKDTKAAKKALDMLDLVDASNKKVKFYSLGMKQRLGIALAIMNRPRLVILDEPLNGLDPVAMATVRDLIRRLNRKEGTTFLISSHNLPELHLVATHYGIIDTGRCLMEMTHEQLEEELKGNHCLVFSDASELEQIEALDGLCGGIKIDENSIVFSKQTDIYQVVHDFQQKGLSFKRIENYEMALEQFFRVVLMRHTI